MNGQMQLQEVDIFGKQRTSHGSCPPRHKGLRRLSCEKMGKEDTPVLRQKVRLWKKLRIENFCRNRRSTWNPKL